MNKLQWISPKDRTPDHDLNTWSKEVIALADNFPETDNLTMDID